MRGPVISNDIHKQTPLKGLKVRKTQEGGLTCVSFFFVSPTDVTVQKQLTMSF